MQTLIFTGAAPAAAIAAAASAAAAAAQGQRALVASFGPAHPAAALAGGALAPQPRPLAPGLDLWTLDALGDLGGIYSALRALSSGGPAIGADELPVIPGSDLFLGVAGLRRLADQYDVACVDAGPPEALLRALAVPDTFRWVVRLLLGLDRGPGRSPASLARALIPTGLIPFPLEWVGQVQDARVNLERLRDETIDPAAVRVRYVLRPDRAGLDEARVALPALQLFGLAVDALVAGPLLPDGAEAAGLGELAAEQAAAVEESVALFAPRPLLRLPAAPTPADAAALAPVGAALYAGAGPLDVPAPAPPLRLGGPPDPFVAMSLPGLPREALGLTLSGDELIVRAGPFRRHILLPDGLRGTTKIRAARQGDELVIRPRA